MSRWTEADPKLFFSKKDSTDPRLGDLAQSYDDKGKGFVIGGYPDDEGIMVNGGRVGAREAPSVIRKHFYKMTPSPFCSSGTINLFDNGDLTAGTKLANRHEEGRRTVSSVLKTGSTWIGLGGGHDYGYADGSGFLDVYDGEKPLIINFDAHLDVRPYDQGFSSGTPFRRILDEFSGVEFWEIGIQSQCNSKAHLEWLHSKGGHSVSWDDFTASGLRLVEYVVRQMGDSLLRPRPTFISVDIDGFSSAYAPGCSQSFATGFEPREFFELFDLLCNRLNVRVLGIYEVSPPLDLDERTSKLAALIMHRFVSL